MKKGLWVIFLFPIMALGVDCRELVATAFGFEKPTTVALSKGGRLLHIEDTSKHFPEQPGVKFNIQDEDSGLKVSGLKSLAARPAGEAKDAILLYVDENDHPQFVVPGFGPVNLILPNAAVTTAASMHTTSIREVQKRAVENEGTHFWSDVKAMAEGQPMRLYFATGTGIYTSTVRSHALADLESDMRELLVENSIVELWPADLARMGREKVRPVPDAKVEFSLMSEDKDGSMWIPMLPHERALEVSRFRKVLDFPGDFAMKSVDFVVALDPKHVLLASEIKGEMEIWDLQTQKVSHKLSFPSPGWLDSISGHELGGVFHVWAINQVDRKIYRWTSDDSSGRLTEFPKQLPNGVLPVQIATAGEELAERTAPPYPIPGMHQPFYLFGNLPSRTPVGQQYSANVEAQLARGGALLNVYRPETGETFGERILVLGDDGKLYGWAEVKTGFDRQSFWLTDDNPTISAPPPPEDVKPIDS